MKSFLSLVGVLLLCIYSVNADAQTGVVRGNLYDKDTGEPIIYGNVYLKGTTRGTTTDLNGFFVIPDIPVGEYILVGSYIGYDTVRSEIKLNPGSIEFRNLYMTAGGVNLGVINISAQKQQARSEIQISKIQVTPRQIKALPSAGGEPDIAQYLQVIPGVISTGDQGGQIYIRGGSPVQNKIMLDGLTIYNPFHSIGFFSVFETEIIKNVDVLTGGFGAEHAGRISAIVDINTREGNKTRFGGFVSGSPFMAKVQFEGPIVKFKEGGGSTSFILTGKKSLIEESSKTLYSYAAQNDSIGLPFSFQDLYGKISINSANGSRVNIFGFNFEDGFNNPDVASIDWKNQGVGANFQLVPAGSDILFGGRVGVTNYKVGINEDDTEPRDSRIREINAALDFTFFGSNNEFKYGLELRSVRTDFNFFNPFGISLTQFQNTTELGGFFKYRQIFNKLVFEPSVRLQYYASLSTFSLEPRLGLKYNLTDKLRIKAAGGLYSQNLLSTSNERDVVNLFNGFLSGPESQVLDFEGNRINNKLQKSIHLVGGIEIDLNDNLTLNIEGYWKDFPQLIIVNRNKLSEEQEDYALEVGEAYGGDFSIKYETSRMYLWGTYSHGYVNRNDGEQEYPTIFDRRHNVNLLGTYDLDEDGTWQFSIRWNLGSGFPFTKTKGFYNYQSFLSGVSTDYETNNPKTVGIIYSDERNGGRLPYYHRLDVSVRKTIRISKYTNAEINVSVTNAYDRENIFYFDRIEYERVNQLPIIPSMSLKLSF